MKKFTTIFIIMLAFTIFFVIPAYADPYQVTGGSRVIDLDNDPAPLVGENCGDTGLALYQSFVPKLSPLVGVQLRLQATGNLPSEGVNVSIHLRQQNPTGSIVASSTRHVQGLEMLEDTLVGFSFDPVNLDPHTTYFIELESVTLPGESPLFSWLGRNDNPYPRGNHYDCTGNPDSPIDLNFKTYALVFPRPTMTPTPLPFTPLVYASHVVDDDTSGQSNGDNDGIIECGESIELWVDLLNQGSSTITGTNVRMSTSSPYVTWLEAVVSFPDIPGGAIATGLDDFNFTVDANMPDGQTITFDLEIMSNQGGPWIDSFTVSAGCPLSVIDQSQPLIDYGFWFDNEVIRWQEFLPTLDNLTEIVIFMQKNGNPGNLIVEIRTQDGLTVLGQEIISEADVPFYYWKVVDFSPNISITPGTIYRIYVYSDTDVISPDDSYFWRGSNFSNYGNSCPDCENDVSGSWPNYDYAFFTYGFP